MDNEISFAKPIPLPRSRVQLQDNSKITKPVPLPRRHNVQQHHQRFQQSLLQDKVSPQDDMPSPPVSLGSISLPSSLPDVEEESSEETDLSKIPDSPNMMVQKAEEDGKRGTINIFQLANQLNDPFTDFDTNFASTSAGKASSSNSSSPIVPPAVSKDKIGSERIRSILSEISFTSPLQDLDEKTRRRISTLSSISSSSTNDDRDSHYNEPPPPRPLSSSDISRSSRSGSGRSWTGEGQEESLLYPKLEQELFAFTTKSREEFGSASQLSLGSDSMSSDNRGSNAESMTGTISSPESTESFSFEYPKSFSHEDSSTSSNSQSVKVVHEYDEVAVEDGNVVLLENVKRRTLSTSLSLTSRDSVVAEFDPLLTPPLGPETKKENLYPNLNGEVNPDRNWSPTLDVDSNGNPCQVNSAADETKIFKGECSPRPADLEKSSALSADGRQPLSGTDGKRAHVSSAFFKRFSNKLRLNAIKEETPSGSKDKVTSVMPLNEQVVFSTNLFKSGGLTRKEWSRKRVVLSKGCFAFYNEKSEVVSEIPLAKVVVISKKEDSRTGQSGNSASGTTLKFFELGMFNWKNSTLLLAGGDDAERASWMSKYIEAFTSCFPLAVRATFDRGGWCYLKESVMGVWRPGWLLLKDRLLYYAYHEEEEYFEMDLRKVRSIDLSEKEEEHRYPSVNNSEVLTVDFICRILYVQTESAKVTRGWESSLKAASTINGPKFEDMQLTMDDIPVVVDKCIDFLYAHGILAEGIYRQNGANSRIAQVLGDFKKDAWAVQISSKDFSPHDVAGALKRFFRTLPEPLMTTKLYPDWIAIAMQNNQQKKLAGYMQLLESLPPINYNILRRLICHLNAVHEFQDKNLMPLINLAPIWGPTLMTVDGGVNLTSYDAACAECEVVKDLIEGYHAIFRVNEEERMREQKMQFALESFHLGSLRRKCSGDMKLWVYLWEVDESVARNVTLSPNTTAQSVVEKVLEEIGAVVSNDLSVHEVVCNRALERPLPPSENVVDTVLRWSMWSFEDRKNNFLIVKKNEIYNMLPKNETGKDAATEVRWADCKTKSCRKSYLCITHSAIQFFKDAKCSTEHLSLKIEDIVWYAGSDPKRNVPSQWCFSIMQKSCSVNRTKEEPYYGWVICCSNEQDLYRLIGALVRNEYPEVQP